MTLTKIRRVSLSLTVATASAALGVATASATPTASTLPQPGFGSVQLAGALPNQQASNHHAEATAEDGLALGVSVKGGHAVANASHLSGPAAIAVGPEAHAETWGITPGLALGVAGPGSTVKVSGKQAAQCDGTWALAGDFQTLTGCALVPFGEDTVAVEIDPRPFLHLHK